MKLSDLKVNDVIKIKLKHWPKPELAIVEGFSKEHCQLHGDYIGKNIDLREIKANGKKRHMYSLLTNTETELLCLTTLDGV